MARIAYINERTWTPPIQVLTHAVRIKPRPIAKDSPMKKQYNLLISIPADKTGLIDF